MSFFSHLPVEDLGLFLRVVQESVQVRRHLELFVWLQGNVQRFIPHEILIAGWGDFSLGLIHFDVISPLPGIRTAQLEEKEISPFLRRLFYRWMDIGRSPYTMEMGEGGFAREIAGEHAGMLHAFQKMRSAIIQGIKDERGRHDCLYVALSSEERMDQRAREAMEVLLPYIDTSLRQVAHLPTQFPVEPPTPANPQREAGEGNEDDEHGLSSRELEILEWVRQGKTNQEIGAILDISAFTVKNHLQRVFKKLDVINRAQAVARFEQTYKNLRA